MIHRGIIMNVFNFLKKIKQDNLITPKTYKEMLDAGHFLILLDVRTQAEYDHAHIKEAILFPVSFIESYIEAHFPDKTLTYILYCRSGIRSQSALNVMKSLGYISVYDMGGIIDWPYETIT